MHYRWMLFLIISFFVPIVSHASVTMTEVMYDASGTDTDHEWVEIHNTGSESVDLTGWKFFEANVNHGLTSATTFSIAPNGYAIIAGSASQFQVEYPSVSVPVFDTSMSLSNTGEVLSLKDASLSVVSTSTYDPSLGAAGDGNSLSMQADGSWRASSATPGAPNSSSTVTNTDDTATTEVAPDEKDEEAVAQNITVSIAAATNVFEQIEVTFTPTVLGRWRETLTKGKLYWNFGDGTTQTAETVSPVHHTYVYPGKYVVALEYSQYVSALEPDVETTATITVTRAPITLSQTMTSVTIKNTGSRELFLDNWRLRNTNGIESTFPRKTIVLPGAELTFEFKSLGLPDGAVVSLFYPNNISFDTVTSSSPVLASQTASSYKKVSTVSSSRSDSASTQITLAAVASAATDETLEVSPKKNSTILYVGVAFLIIVCGFLLYRLRKSKSNEDEIEIIETQ